MPPEKLKIKTPEELQAKFLNELVENFRTMAAEIQDIRWALFQIIAHEKRIPESEMDRVLNTLKEDNDADE